MRTTKGVDLGGSTMDDLHGCMTVDEAKIAALAVAKYINEHPAMVIKSAIGGYPQDFGGFAASVYWSGVIVLCGTGYTPSDGFAAERKIMEQAYDNYVAIHEIADKLAKIKAEEMVASGKLYRREGNRFIAIIK